MTERVARLGLRMETDSKVDLEELAKPAVDLREQPLEFTDPGEPCSPTYVISEIQADGTVRPLRNGRIGC
jgi:hypothetical protein